MKRAFRKPSRCAQNPRNARERARVSIASLFLPVVAVAAVVVSTFPGTAHAQSCTSPILSPCVNSDAFWPHPGISRLPNTGGTETIGSGEVSAALVMSYQSRPVVLRVPSPNPVGSDQSAIENQLNANFLWAVGLTDRLQFNLALPVTISQNGGGLSPITGGSSALQTTALRDARLGILYAITPRPRVDDETLEQAKDAPLWGHNVAIAARFGVSAPTGASEHFAGEQGVVWMPSISADLRFGRFFAATELGMRIRRPSEFLGARIGTQIVQSIGAGVKILREDKLSVGVEARALHTLTEQADVAQTPSGPKSTPNGTFISPAEWNVFVRSAPVFAGDVAFEASGGGALPLGDEVPVTTPRMRFVFGIRYAPLDRDSDHDGILDKYDLCPHVSDLPADKTRPRDGCPQPAVPAQPDAPADFTAPTPKAAPKP